MFNDVDEILSVEEACELMKIGKNTIYELLQTGQLKGYKCGRLWRISKEAVMEYVIKSSGLATSHLF